MGTWEPRNGGHEMSVDDIANSGYLYWARTEPADTGGWRWEVWAEDEWNMPMGNSSGITGTESEAKAAAELWMRPDRHLRAVPNPDTSRDTKRRG